MDAHTRYSGAQPGAPACDIEDKADSKRHPSTPHNSRSKSWFIVFQMILFYVSALAFMVGHLILVVKLHGQPVETSAVSQGISSAISNFMALMAELLLISGSGIAYNQIVWRRLRRQSHRAQFIDKLLTLARSPWNLLRPSVLLQRHFELPIIGFACFLIPIAAMFPPGALTVEFENGVLPTKLSNVPTVNLSDWGGTYRSFVDSAFFEVDADVAVMEVRPRLKALAAAVLTSGEPVAMASPCSGPCTYTLMIDGPYFNCSDAEANEEFIKFSNNLFEAVDRSEKFSGSDSRNMYWFRNNSFQVSWRGGAFFAGKPSPVTIEAIDCSVSMASYSFEISILENGARTIARDISEVREIWNNSMPIQAYYYYDWFPDGILQEAPTDPESLARNITNTQAYTLSRAVTGTLAGNISGAWDGAGTSLVFYVLSDNIAVGSPYFGLSNRYSPEIIFSRSMLQKYLEDVILSTISLNPIDEPLWVNNGDVDALEGADTYFFRNENKLQFYAPYAACLVVTAIIYAMGAWSLWQNGPPAGESFLQFATALSTSKTLHELGEACSSSSGRCTEAETRLLQVEVRYGTRKRRASGGRSWEKSLGFGTDDELEPLSRHTSNTSAEAAPLRFHDNNDGGTSQGATERVTW